jgi:hypothetical protein
MAKKRKKKAVNEAKVVYYRQCQFTSPTQNGYRQSVAWIPEHLAVVGKMIYFGKKTDKPERLWEVKSVGGRMSEDYLRERERDYLTQRQASDI